MEMAIVEYGSDLEKAKVPLANRTPSINIHFESITCTVAVNDSSFLKREKKQILKNVNGDFQSGKLTAIIGPSGSGKSTLMDIVSGYRLRGVSGRIFVNGEQKGIKELTRKSCYIMQDEKLQPLLTVQEAMTFAANVKLPENFSDDHKQSTIMKILKNLSLREQVNTLTKHLSGGQRKRLAIALELISNPPVLFLDEPTSGLDSKAARQCLEILHRLSHEGRTVVCSIHQPSTLLLNLFDNMYFLANGKCIYQGTVNNLVPFLAANDAECPVYHNPVEYVVEICVLGSQTEIDHLMMAADNGKSQKWLDNPICWNSIPLNNIRNGQYSVIEGDFQYPTSFSHQFRWLIKRIFIIASRDMFLTYLILASSVCVGFALSAFFYNLGNDSQKIVFNYNLIFCCILFVMYFALVSRIVTFPNEIPVIKREYFNRWYSLKAYYFATLIGDIPVQVLSVTIFTCIVYYFTGQILEWFRFGLTVLTLVILGIIFQDYGICMGTLFDVQNGLVAGMLSTNPWVMFSGFLLYYRDTPVIFRWIFRTSVIRRAFEALIISIYGFNRKPLACDEVYCHFKYPNVFLKNVDVDSRNFIWNFVVMAITLIVLKMCCYFALKYKMTFQR